MKGMADTHFVNVYASAKHLRGPSCLFMEAQQYGTSDMTCFKYMKGSSSVSTKDCHVFVTSLVSLQCELVISNGTLATTV